MLSDFFNVGLPKSNLQSPTSQVLWQAAEASKCVAELDVDKVEELDDVETRY